MEEKEELKNLILEKWDNGYVVFASFDGIHAIKFDDFIKQPLEGMLYDINRDLATVLTFLDDPKWVNDYALTRLLKYYHDRCKELEQKTKV